MTDIINTNLNHVSTPASSQQIVTFDSAGNFSRSTIKEAVQSALAETHDWAWVNNHIGVMGSEQYRGTTITPSQYAEIDSGNYRTIGLGDTWNINGCTIRLIGANTYWYRGDNQLSKQHAMFTFDGWAVDQNGKEMAPDGETTHFMNATDTSKGGILASDAVTKYLSQTKIWLESTFGNHLVKWRGYYSNSVDSDTGLPNGGEWTDTEVMLFNEIQAFGTTINGANSGGSGVYNIGADTQQVPYFRLRPNYLTANHGKNVWLRDVVSASRFANASFSGDSYHWNASAALPGLRAFFLLA